MNPASPATPAPHTGTAPASEWKTTLRNTFRPDEHTMVLRPTYLWSRAMLWTIVLVTVGVVIWSCVAELDEVVHATGKLQPRGSILDVQSSVPGVIAEMFVKEGQSVRSGETLARLDTKVAQSRVRSLQEQLASMKSEQSFYEQLFKRSGAPVAPGSLPPDVVDLAKNHASLLAEDRLLRAILDSNSDTFSLSEDQKNLLSEEQKNRIENYERITSQLEQGRLLEANTKKIYEAYSSLLASGAGARIDFLQREAAWIESVARVKNLESQQQNIATQFRKDALTRLGENTKRLAEIEANLTKTGLANSQHISEVTARMDAAQEELGQHEIKSIADGVVFQIVASKPGHVVGAKDIVVKIVPTDELIAQVDITNRDIGFINSGLACEVEIDTFPKREFGFLEGTVYFVGSDALPPTDVKRYYSFPAKIEFQRHELVIRGKSVPLQSGMSVNANIKVRKRRVINLFLDNILRPIDKMKEVR
jgi:HlyD family secretion protein